MSQRVIVVLGYSSGDRDELHPVCAERLREAERIARPSDVVVLSGWARAPHARSEAALMADAWRSEVLELVVDPDARTTVENLANAADDVKRIEAEEVVVVTSSWHAPRATAAMRWLLRHSRVTVSSASPPERSLRASLRELTLWLLLPFQLWHAARRRQTLE